VRINQQTHDFILNVVKNKVSADARVHLFGSRVDDKAKGGDVDLLVESDGAIDDPALVAAQLSAQISRYMHGRQVDVVLSAPNLTRQPIHAIAVKTGVRL
jgi:predicted nucleotidyltransferase